MNLQSKPNQLPIFVLKLAIGVYFLLALAASAESESGPPSLQASPPEFPESGREIPSLKTASLNAIAETRDPLSHISLVPGTNLISLPKLPLSGDPTQVLASLSDSFDRAYAYDACSDKPRWLVYDPTNQDSSTLTEITLHLAVQIEATETVDLPVEGDLPDTTTIPLCTGWNLMGFPAAQPRAVHNVFHSILPHLVRVFEYDPFDPSDPWAFWDAQAPDWANDLHDLRPGYGYWVLVDTDVTLEIKNVGEAPEIAFSSPVDLDVVTGPTEIHGSVASDLLESWQLRYRGVGEADWIDLASGTYPLDGKLGDFDPTLLLNGMYELELIATDLQGLQATDSIVVVVEGNMKIGHFALSFVDLAIPVSGLDIEVVRTYDSRQRHLQGDFGYGWSLDIRQGSYRNNRPPGDGWQIRSTEGPWGLPCSRGAIFETKNHLTTVRLSDQEIYRFRFVVEDPGTIIGGCIGRADFEYVDGPVPGASLEILGKTSVLYQNNTDELRDPNTFALYVPEDVRLTTRDGRIFHFDLNDGVTHLEDLNGNALEITPAGMTHSSGLGIEFVRDAEGRITRIVDPMGNANIYDYDGDGNLVTFTDRMGAETQFSYTDEHYLEDVVNALGVRAVRTEYDDGGRMIRLIDASGKVTRLDHDLDARREIITDRLGFPRLLEYDGRGNVIKEIDALGHTTTRTYDSKNRLLSETDPLGNTSQNTYDGFGQLVSSSNGAGNLTRFTYDHRGRLTSTTDPRGHVTSMTYDGRGNLLRMVDPAGATTEWTHDARGLILTEVDALGHTTSFAYDSHGRQIEETDALGATFSTQFDLNGRPISHTSSRTLPDGTVETLIQTMTFDVLGRVTSVTDAKGGTTASRYDALGRLSSSTDALVRKTETHYDLLGRPVVTIYPDGSRETRAFDAEGRLIALTDQAGNTTSFTLDALGRQVEISPPDGSTTQSAYDAVGNLISSTNALGHITSYAYDGAGRRTQTTDALGNQEVTSYDAAGNIIAVKNALDQETTFTNDSMNRRLRKTTPDGRSIAYEYDAIGQRSAMIDAAGHRTEYRHDAKGQLVEVLDALGGRTLYAYDEVGNRISQTDARGKVTQFGYDALGLLTLKTTADGSSQSFEYDAMGNWILHRDAMGSVTHFTYDALDQLTLRQNPDGSNTRFEYTPTGRRAKMIDGRGATNYSYDELDRLVSVSIPEGWSLHNVWDPAGRRTSVTLDFGEPATGGLGSRTTSYSYDPLGRLNMVNDSTGGTTHYAFGPTSLLDTLIQPNGMTTTYAYDPAGRLTNLQSEAEGGNVIQSYQYTLGPRGDRAGVEEHDGTRRDWTYDALGRLSKERVVDAEGSLIYEHQFDYDPVGNRLSQRRAGSDGSVDFFTYQYDARNRLLSESRQGVPITTYAWDLNGRRTSSTAHGETETYSWTPEGYLSSVHQSDGTVVRWTYDGDGNLASQSTETAGETGSSRTYVTDTTQILSRLVADISDDSQIRIYTWGDGLLHWQENGQAQYAHVDVLGSLRASTDGDGNLTDRIDYEAFGAPTGATASSAWPFGFAGEYVDSESGLSYHRARWMDPSLGRFISPDPFEGFVSRPQSLHPYTYASLDPVNKTDPTGLFTVSETLTGLTIQSNLNIAQQAFVIPLAATLTCSAIYAVSLAAPAGSSALAPPLDGCAGPNQMRVQFQTANTNLASLAIYETLQTPRIGVTALQVRNGLGVLYEESSLVVVRRLLPPLKTAIIRTSAALTPIVAGGGVVQAENFLRETFYDGSIEYRVDVENVRGHNLRF